MTSSRRRDQNRDEYSAWELGIGTERAARPDLICNPNLPNSERTVARFFRMSCFAAPEALLSGDVRYGTAGRTVVTGPGIVNWDLSIRKNTGITERIQTEFRAEFFNALTTPTGC